MVSIRSLPESDLRRALELHNQYTAQDRSLEEVRPKFERTPSLFPGAYDDEHLIGMCLGWPTEPTVVELVGIGVDPDRRGRGIGSSLLQRFETEAKALGMEQITMGSAGGDVARFYASHGYSAESILVRGMPETLPSDFRNQGYEVADERRLEDGSVKLYLAVENRDPSDLQTVRDSFGDDEAIYIMQKNIAEG